MKQMQRLALWLKTIVGYKRTSAKEARFSPSSYYVDYRIGTEKSILDGVKQDIHNKVQLFGWDKRLVEFRIEKLSSHPYIEPGYIYEIIYNGDGYSFIDQICDSFMDKKNRSLAIELSQKGISVIHFSGNSQQGIESENWDDPNREVSQLSHLEGLKFLSFEENIRPTKKFYVDNYVLFYISQFFFISALLSICVAGMYKYEWVDQSKIMIDKSYYTESKFMPINTIRQAADPQNFSEVERTLSIRYSSLRGWYIVTEKKITDTEFDRFEKRINRDGSLGAETKSEPERLDLLGIPAKRTAIQKKPQANKKPPTKKDNQGKSADSIPGMNT